MMAMAFSFVALNPAFAGNNASTGDNMQSLLGKAGDSMGQATGGKPKADIATIVGNVLKIILTLLGVILLILVVYAGFLWMTAGGNPEQVTKAKQYLANAVIGLAICLSAYAITGFVVDNLSAATTN